MARPTFIQINTTALLHNVSKVRAFAKGKKIIAMVKANAYGSGLRSLIATLEGQVDALGVASVEEAMLLRKFGSRMPCILFQGVFHSDEYNIAVQENFPCVVHHKSQVEWLLNNPLSKKLKVWIKVNTGMHRLGFELSEVANIFNLLSNCEWVDKNIGLMTHLARADEPKDIVNYEQIKRFNSINLPKSVERSMANSAAILALPDSHADVVRPGIMLYGISPFSKQTGQDLGLRPIFRLVSAISVIHDYPPNSYIGYSGTWKTKNHSKIGIVPIGYGDGYPRHIGEGTPVWINGELVPIVGRVSMDMLTVDLTNFKNVKIGDQVELWGNHLPIEVIAKHASTSPYELLCQMSMRVHLA